MKNMIHIACLLADIAPLKSYKQKSVNRHSELSPTLNGCMRMNGRKKVPHPVDIGGAPLLANISANFQKKF
jgi:hypothetical protein